MIFNEATPHISVNFSRCQALPEPNLFPIKGNTIMLASKNEKKMFSMICSWKFSLENSYISPKFLDAPLQLKLLHRYYFKWENPLTKNSEKNRHLFYRIPSSSTDKNSIVIKKHYFSNEWMMYWWLKINKLSYFWPSRCRVIRHINFIWSSDQSLEITKYFKE